MIEKTEREAVTILQIRHGKANALDLELCLELRERFREHADSPGGALVLAGSGAIFCAGVDLLRVLDDGPEYVREFLPALMSLFESIDCHPRPVVAAINGHAVAGGCVLACAADYRTMAAGRGRIGMPELRVGVPFPTIAMEILRRSIVPSRLPELVYQGATFGPEEAMSLGLVDAVGPPEDLLDGSVATAKSLLAVPAPVFALTKQQIREPARERCQTSGCAADRFAVEIWACEATFDAIRTYVHQTLKRPKG